jgi:hypothetical protein
MSLLLMLLVMIMIESPDHVFAQAFSPPPSSTLEKPFTASLGRAESGPTETSFSTETPKIYLRWRGETLTPGETVRCIWIAEDVGKAAPANYHVDEAATKANEPQAAGAFTLSKPKADWPKGKYRAEIYVGTKLVETLPFTIEKLRGD